MPVTGSTARPNAGLSAKDLRFLERFEQCTLPESAWTHLAHVRAAWTSFRLYPAADAIGRIRRGIRRYNTDVLGRPGMYHETVTVAFSRLVADRMRSGETWDAFVLRIADLLDGNSPVLLGYYSRERLFSADARERFVEPDLAKLPNPG
jgi:hypothetical protein